MTNIDEDFIMVVSSDNKSENDLDVRCADTELPFEPFVQSCEMNGVFIN